MRAFYYGCLKGINGQTQVGHHLYNERLMSVTPGRSIDPWPFPFENLDGRFQPRRPGVGHGYDGNSGAEVQEGKARLTKVGGWTVLAFWDYSGDSRGASNSSFVFDTDLDGEAALKAAKATFPLLFERFPFEVKVIEEASDDWRR